MAEQIGDAIVQTPAALRLWLRHIVPMSPVNHSQLVVTSEAVKGFIQQTPFASALNVEVDWLSSACADFVAAVGEKAAPFTIFHLPAGIASSLDGLAASLGQDQTGLKYLLALLMAYPLGAVFAMVHGKHLKNLFSLVAGLFLA